jgi:predicted nuclease of predicted toxin-antitoxin system
MRFLVDECTGPAVARWLEKEGHDVFSVFDQAPGRSDTEIIRRAYTERRILITNDKDFGEKVYREQYPHRGIVLLRLDDERSPNKIAALRRFLRVYGHKLLNRFVVVTADQVRFAGESPGRGTS